jgi:hypothetical protein
MYMKKSAGAKRARDTNDQRAAGDLVSFSNAAAEHPTTAVVTPVIQQTSSDKLDSLSKRARSTAAAAPIPAPVPAPAPAPAPSRRSGRSSRAKAGDDEDNEMVISHVEVAPARGDDEMITVSDPVTPILHGETDADHIQFAIGDPTLHSHMNDSSTMSRGRRNDVWETNFQHLVDIGNATGNCNVALSTPGLIDFLG